MFTGSWQMRTLLFILIQCSSFCIQARINNGELSSLKVLLILQPSLISLTMQFQSLKFLTNPDGFIHSSIHSTNIYWEPVKCYTLEVREEELFSSQILCKNTIHLHIEFSKFLPLNISWWLLTYKWYHMNSLKFLHFLLLFKIYGDIP